MNNLDTMAEEIRKELAAKDEAREKMLPLCRDSIRYSSTAIRAVHRQEFNEAITGNDLVCAAVLSGNRNFEARIHPNLKANFLASPPLVVAYAIAGTVLRDLTTEPVGIGKDGPVYPFDRIKDHFATREI